MYRATEVGLNNVWLANGYDVVDSKYGKGTSIHDLDGLCLAIGRALSMKPRLTGMEIRFLRKQMGMSQRSLGDLLGVGDQAVALWEKRGRLPKTADRLLRVVYSEHSGGNEKVIELIDRINHTDVNECGKIVAEENSDGGWIASLAA